MKESVPKQGTKTAQGDKDALDDGDDEISARVFTGVDFKCRCEILLKIHGISRIHTICGHF